jgi:ABC-2 type transport system ATP-binding protein
VPGVVIRDLVVSYGTSAVVDGFTMTADFGTITALIGPNGAGKTTTVEVCVGLRARQSGQVLVCNVDPANSTPGDRSEVGVMLQDGGIPANARPGAWLQSLARLYQRAVDPTALMAQLGISADWPTVRRMSGGQVQRVKLASALIGSPRVLFLDEPTAGLDHEAKADLMALIRQLKHDGTCIVLTTHDLGEVEQLADHVVMMNHGVAVATGSLAELTASHNGLRFQAPPRLAINSLQSVLPPENSVHEERPGDYIVSGHPTPELLATVTHWCAEQGVVATSIRMGTQDLSDVYERVMNDRSPG